MKRNTYIKPARDITWVFFGILVLAPTGAFIIGMFVVKVIEALQGGA